MKRLLLLSPIIFSCITLHAQHNVTPQETIQQPASGGITLSGTVKDSVLNQALEFSSVMLVKKGEQAADGINSDSTGYFEFKNVQPGEYILNVYYVGYKKLELPVTVNASSTNIALGMVNMNATGGTTLKEVQIVDIKQLIEQRPDGMVYNAEKDLTNKGTTAEQVLRKVPMVTVDFEGNVQMRGSDNIRVLIDGKPSTIIAASVKDALKQIPADNIKSVEVITSPGARYDAEGAAGVINIITRKSLMKGISGSVHGELSYNAPQEFFTGNGGFNLNYRNNNFGLSLNAGASHWQMVLATEAMRHDDDGTELTQKSRFEGGGDFLWSQLSADYQIDSLQSVQAGVSYRPGNWIQDVDMSNMLKSANIPAYDFRRNTHSESPRDNIGFNASYSKKFRNNPKRTLDILSQYSSNTTNSNYDLQGNNIGSDLIIYKEKNTNENSNKEFTIQGDYVQPLKNPKQKIETGLKFINRDITSEYELKSWTNGQGTDFSIDPNRTNRLDYTQQVAAVYGQFTTPLAKSLSMIAGARYEFTNIKGHQQEANSAFESQFNNVLPNLSFIYDLKNYSKLKLAYNKRIERPSIAFINPYINSSDSFNITQGNPALVPENTHNVELTYSTFFGNTSLNLSSFYRHTGNAIENVTRVEGNTSFTTYENIAKNNTVGLDFYGSTNLFNRWMINLNGSAYYKMLKSQALNAENSGIQWSTSMYTSFKLSERFSLAGFAMYNGNQIKLQGSQDGWYYYFVGVQMAVLKGKGTVNLSAENFFTPEIHMTTRYRYQNAEYVNQTTYFGRGLKVSFSLNFGKMSFVNKKSIKNDDLKEGGGGQQDMGGGR